jgi:RNA polymerase sigma-70 factor, ECF subfamily
MIMDQPTDQELVIQAQAGDNTSFAALVDRHYMTAYRFAFRWSRSREDAEDITQEVFVKLARSLHLFDGRSQFTTWLYSITANCARDHARKNRRWAKEFTADPPEEIAAASPNPGPESNAMARGIGKAIDELPEKLKEAMLLVYAEDLSHKEAARVIGCAETTVSWRIFQAKRKLRKVLS